MYITPNQELRAINRIRNTKLFPTIKDCLEAIETVNNKVFNKKCLNNTYKLDNMLRLSHIKECNLILEEM